MRRLLGFIVFVFLIAILIGIIAYAKMELVLSYVLSSKMKTNVTIEDVRFSKMEQIHVQNTRIGNPYQYPSRYALEVGSLDISTPFERYFQNITYIDKIELDNVIITVESVNHVTNWEALMNNLESKSEKSHSYSVIKNLTFKNLTVIIQGSDGTYQTHTIAKLTLVNIKTDEGDFSQRLTQAILKQILFNIKNWIKIPLKMTQDAINSPLDTTLDGLKSLNPFGK